MKFCEMYSDGFNYDDVGISVREKGFIFKREDCELNFGSKLCIENPIDITRDLGVQV